MKNVLISLFSLCIFSLFFSNCTDYRYEKFSYKGKGHAHALKNDILWNAGASISYIKNDTICIHIFTFDEMGIEREHMSIFNIHRNIGKEYLQRRSLSNPFKNTTAYYCTSIADGDVTGESYDIWDEDTNNFFKITEIDSINHMIRGEFNIWFGSDSINIHTLKFSDGRFEVPYP